MSFLAGISNDLYVIGFLMVVVAAIIYVYQRRRQTERNKLGFIHDETHKKAAAPAAAKQSAQGSKNDFLQTMSDLITLARKKKWYIIAPAVMQRNGNTTQFIAVLFTPQKIIAIRPFGFGGVITAGPGDKEWKQAVNGTERKIMSPTKDMREAAAIVQSAMDAAGIHDMTLETLSVFTNSTADLRAPSNSGCYMANDLIEMLLTREGFEKTDEPTKAAVEKLKKYIQKPSK